MTVLEEEDFRRQPSSIIGRYAVVRWCSLILILLTVSYCKCFYKTAVPYITTESGDFKLKRQRNAKSKEQNTSHVSDLDTFRPDNLIPSQRIPCGKNKCFFLVKSDSQVGYLVDRSQDHDRRAILDSAWQLATSLKKEVKMKHFLEGPPLNISVTSNLRSMISRNLWRIGRHHYIEEDYFPEGSTVYFERNRVAPELHILYGLSGTKRQIFAREVDGFLSNVPDIESFSKAFNESLSIATRVVRLEPCLCHDFHIMMDTSGSLFHLDFDRCFVFADEAHGASVIKREIPEKLKEKCLLLLDEMRALVTGALQRNTTRPT